MLVVSWNIRAIVGAGEDRRRAIVARLAEGEPDIVLLQEVGNEVARHLLPELEACGFVAFFGGVEGATEKKYGNVIASRAPLRPVQVGWAKAPWPQLLTRASVAVDGREIDVISAHMPNGSGNGWKKIETFEALAAALAASPSMPRIVGGDFNEPQAVLADGEVVSFGAKRNHDGTYSLEGTRRSPPSPRVGIAVERHPRKRWNDGVKGILGRDAAHGLRHAHHAVHGFENTPVTHLVRNQPRFFDHLLVSGDFVVEDAGFFDEWRTSRLSDHSAAWARVALDRQVPD